MAEVLVPHLCQMDAKDAEIKRLVGLMSKIPTETEQRVGELLSKMSGYLKARGSAVKSGGGFAAPSLPKSGPVAYPSFGQGAGGYPSVG